ncbi:MAG: aspartate aminotransferase family protein [Cyclobacteriaceae bacterium]
MSEITTKTQHLTDDAHFNMYRRMPITLLSGKGCRVVDSEGKEYIDALAGIAVNALGHGHPKIIQALQDQAAKLIHISNIYYNAPQSALAKILTEVSGLEKAYFCNSGAEANEGAIKLARKYAHNKGKKGLIVSMENCFHGRTLATIAMGSAKYQKGFEPLPEGFRQVPFNDFTALENLKAKEDIIAVFIEPVQGEGGIRPAQIEYLKQVRKWCSDHDILLVFDEIQCGIGRTGKIFAYQYAGILPDILTLAKGLGGGVPIGAVVAKESVASAFQPGDHGTTFGGNPLAAIIAYTTLKTIIEEDLCKQVQQKSEYFVKKLKELAAKHKVIKEVRGKGLMLGVELKEPGKELIVKMAELGVLANCTAETVIRFLPPLIIHQVEIDQIIEVFDQVLKEK